MLRSVSWTKKKKIKKNRQNERNRERMEKKKKWKQYNINLARFFWQEISARILPLFKTKTSYFDFFWATCTISWSIYYREVTKSDRLIRLRVFFFFFFFSNEEKTKEMRKKRGKMRVYWFFVWHSRKMPILIRSIYMLVCSLSDQEKTRGG